MIFTSYYAAGGRVPENGRVCISNTAPARFHGERRLELAPDRHMVDAWRWGTVTWTEFTKVYTEKMRKLDLKEIGAQLEGKTLFCWEGKSDPHCHRHILADLLRSEGFEVREL